MVPMMDAAFPLCNRHREALVGKGKIQHDGCRISYLHRHREALVGKGKIQHDGCRISSCTAIERLWLVKVRSSMMDAAFPLAPP